MKRLALLGSLLFIAPVQSAFAWGQAAHEMIGAEALAIISEQKHPLEKLLNANAVALKHFSATPETVWKTKHSAEQDTHYFEADAFTRMGTDENTVLNLPAGTYASVLPRYQKLLQENFSYVMEFERNQGEPWLYGTAPWRVLQFYDLAVQALRDKSFGKFVNYAGLVAHYVGNLSEPLNTTLNFDGRQYPIPATGVYAAFEDRIFKARNARPDEESHISKASDNELAGKGLDGLTRDRVFSELLHLVNSGYVFIDPILSSFSDLCSKEHADHSVRALASLPAEAVEKKAKKGIKGKQVAAAPVRVSDSYCDPAISFWRLPQDPQPEIIRKFASGKAYDIAEKRIGAAAALAARVWAAIYNDAGRPALESLPSKLEFIDLAAQYIEPGYLPTEAIGKNVPTVPAAARRPASRIKLQPKIRALEPAAAGASP